MHRLSLERPGHRQLIGRHHADGAPRRRFARTDSRPRGRRAWPSPRGRRTRRRTPATADRHRLIVQCAREDGDAHEGSLPLLLERSGRYPGLVIFTSTVTHPLDSSLTDRFDVVVDFPFPESDARKEIWRNSLPTDARLTDSALDYLATWLNWPGRTIHRCGLAAGAEAAKEGVPLELRHVASVLEHGYRSSELPGQAQAPSAIRSKPEASPVETGFSLASAGHRWRLGALAGLVIAALLGLIIAGTIGSAPASGAGGKVVYAGTARVSVPSSWRREAVPAALSSGLTRARHRFARSCQRFDRHRDDGCGRSLARFPRDCLPPTVAPELVRVDRVVLERYPSRSSFGGGSAEAIYAMPTTVGTIIGVCKNERASSGFVAAASVCSARLS